MLQTNGGTKVVRIAGSRDVLSGTGALLAAGARQVQGARDILQGRQACSAAPHLHAHARLGIEYFPGCWVEVATT